MKKLFTIFILSGLFGIQSIKRPDNTCQSFERIWTTSQFNIYPDDGIADGFKLQQLIDSAYYLKGITKLVFDSSGYYCTNDRYDKLGYSLHFDLTKSRKDHWIYLEICPKGGGHVMLGVCEEKKKGF